MDSAVASNTPSSFHWSARVMELPRVALDARAERTSSPRACAGKKRAGVYGRTRGVSTQGRTMLWPDDAVLTVDGNVKKSPHGTHHDAGGAGHPRAAPGQKRAGVHGRSGRASPSGRAEVVPHRAHGRGDPASPHRMWPD